MARRPGPSAVVLVGMLAAAGAGVPAPAGASADPMLGAPVVGQCHDLGADELAAASYDEAPVDCTTTHTATTIAVAQLPDGLDFSGRGLERFALETCFAAQRRALGTTQRAVRLTAYDVGWFVPTADQQAAGARWVRCDLVLGDARDLQPLPSDVRVGTRKPDPSVARCLGGRDAHVTTCAQPHTFRATSALRLDTTRYPGGKARNRIGADRCRRAVSTLSYRFGWPARAAWRAGDRTLVCYSRTST
ncbi:septum formation family protein [Nocardioides sp. zg-1230]|uniref:septum formation family protein n=1 Tax=Nocardioides sp. zg-1230 TaxID=2736601 RepID=UPI001556911D|nr:septum formation family protein [Nocardioides sp. zg-1230]NPC41327.1 hypothetical protein [Nocardioides sp. zg-1230]